MNRFDRYAYYARAWGSGTVTLEAPKAAWVSEALGVRHFHGASVTLLTVDELDAELRRAGVLPEEAGDDAPDVGPTARDERERAEAEARLCRLILADGQTDTGNRWIAESAGDEIVRLRNDRDDDKAALAGAHAELSRLRGEAQMAHEALEQARAKVEELRAMNARLDDSSLALAADAQHGREQGAAEMRERAAAHCDSAARRGAARGKHEKASVLWGMYHEIRGLPLDGAPTAAPGLTEDERAALRRRGYIEHAGTWQHMWAGPAYDPAKPEDLAELRRDIAEPGDIDKAELSAEDAATLLGAGWRAVDGGWLDPHNRIWTSNPTNADGMRQIAAELRAKAPAAAHGAPGKATGEATAAGTSSLTEEHGAAQGTSQAPGQGAVPHGGDRGQALPKPPRVEVGQRWRHTNDPGLWTVGEVDRHNDDMLATLRTDDGREVRVCQSWLTKGPFWIFLGPAPSPQGPGPQREPSEDVRQRMGAGDVAGALEQHRRDGEAQVSARAAESLSEPTARDAVAGMLLRCGYGDDADELAGGAAPADVIAGMAGAVSPCVPACIAALQALARGDLRSSIDASPVVREYMKICDGAIERLGAEHAEGLWPAASRVKRERDEARAEAAALRERIAKAAPYDGPSIMPGSDIKIDPATWPGDTAEEPSGMRIETRADGEWLVGDADEQSEGCGVGSPHTPHICSRHLDGEHLATGVDRGGGQHVVFARWPIAAPAREDEPSDLEKVAAMQADLSAGLRDGIARMLKDGEVMTSADERVTLIVRGGVEAREVAAACTELLGLPLPPEETQEQIEAWAYNHGFREGERRAKTKAAELQDRWNATRARAADSGNVVKANATLVCILHIRAAFGITDPPTGPGKPPTGEPAPSSDDAFDGFPADVPPEIDEQAAEIAAIVDERVTRVLERRRTRITADLARIIFSATDEDLMPYEIAYRVLRRLEHVHGYGPSSPVVPGEPAPEEAPKASVVTHGGVTVTAPDGMTLGEVWAALKSSPALRVCLDSELRAARESARGTTPADLETARRDIRSAVLEDAFRAGGERAHADGIVEGLNRADGIIRSMGRRGDLSAQHIATLDLYIRTAVAEAMTDVTPADGQPHGVALAGLLELATSWENEAKRLRGTGKMHREAGRVALGYEDAGEARGREFCAVMLRRALVEPPPDGGPDGEKREPRAAAGPPVAPDRETLGREAHDAWYASASKARGNVYHAKWENMLQRDRDDYMAVAESLFNMGVRWATGSDDAELTELARLIDDEQTADASALLERVAARRGEADAHVAAARWELATAERRDPDADLLASLRCAEGEDEFAGEHAFLALSLAGLGITSAGVERDGARHVATVLLEVIERQGETLRRAGKDAHEQRAVHVAVLNGALKRLGAADHEGLWPAAERVKRELTEANGTNVYLEEQRRAHMVTIDRLTWLAQAAPRFYPVAPGPLAELSDRIAALLSDVYSQPADGELRAMPTARSILRIVDEHVRRGLLPVEQSPAIAADELAPALAQCLNGFYGGGEAHAMAAVRGVLLIVNKHRQSSVSTTAAPAQGPTLEALRELVESWSASVFSSVSATRGAAFRACITDLCRVAGIEPPPSPPSPPVGPQGTPGPEAQDGSAGDHGERVAKTIAAVESIVRELGSKPVAVPVAGLKGEPVINLNIEMRVEPGADSSEVAAQLEREIRKAFASATSPDAEPEQPVKPPRNAEQGSLAEAIHFCNLVASEGKRVETMIGSGLAAARVPDFAPPVCSACRGEYSSTYCDPCCDTGVVASTSPPAAQDGSREAQIPPDDRAPEEREASRQRIKTFLSRPDIRTMLVELDRPMQAFLAWHKSPRWQRLIEQGGEAPRDVARGAFLAGWSAHERYAAAEPSPPVKSVPPTGGMGDTGAELDARAIDAYRDQREAEHEAKIGPYREALRVALERRGQAQRVDVKPPPNADPGALGSAGSVPLAAESVPDASPAATCATCGGSGEVNAMDYTGNTEPCDACDPAEAPDPRWEPGATWERIGERHELTSTRVSHGRKLAVFCDNYTWPVGVMTEANGWRYVEPANDGRWDTGAVWEHRGFNGYASRQELVNVLHGRARFFGGLSVAVADLTEENRWRYVGRE